MVKYGKRYGRNCVFEVSKETFSIVILYPFHEIRSKLEMLFYCYLVKGLGKVVAKISIFEIPKGKPTSSLVYPFYETR